MSSYIVSSAPATTVFTDLTLVKSQLHIDHSVEDTLLLSQANGAQKYLENYLGLKFIRQTIIESYDYFSRLLCLSVGPLEELTKVEYMTGDAWVEIDVSRYIVDKGNNPARIMLKPTYSIPPTDDVINPVRITYTVGWADAASVPEEIKNAILLRVGGLYSKREDYGRKSQDASIDLIINYKNRV